MPPAQNDPRRSKDRQAGNLTNPPPQGGIATIVSIVETGPARAAQDAPSEIGIREDQDRVRGGIFRRLRLTPQAFWQAALAVCALLAVLGPRPAVSGDYRQSYDGPGPVGRVSISPGGPQPTDVRQSLPGPEYAREGKSPEFVRIESPAPGTEIEFLTEVDPTLRLDETKVSLWARCSQPNLSLHVRLRFPHQIDPRTGAPLTADMAGGPASRYEETTELWKRLECRPDDRSFQQLMQRLRHLLLPQLRNQADLDTRDVYVEAVVLKARLGAGRTDLLVDDLIVGPIAVPPTTSQKEIPAEPEAKFSRIAMGDNRITKNGRPFIPLILPYHHESIDEFLATGANTAWVQNWDDEALLKEFAARGIGVTATPPRPVNSERGEALPPFTGASAPIDFWMLDVNIPASAYLDVETWIEQLRDADHKHPRPILADVAGRERDFHRHLSLLGSSRFILGTTTAPLEYVEHLDRKQRMGLPGRGMFTLVPLEPADGLLHDPTDGPRIEPEQVFLLANAALSAGYKGIGYWNRNPLSEETRHAVNLMNLQVRLLEPWLATGKVVSTSPVQFGQDLAQGGGTSLSSVVSTRWDNANRKAPSERAARLENELRATVLDSEFGMLVIINWLENRAQYQPGGMVVDDLHLFVKRDVLQAWTVTATGMETVKSLKQVPGGTEITLKQVEQFAYVLITHEQAVRDAVARQISQVRERAARSWVELAEHKIRRVHDVHRQIEFEAPAVMDAADILAKADRYVAAARADFERGSFKSVEENARFAMALTRVVQRRHWENAVRRFATPVSYPYTVAFQTLPQHWKMLEKLGAGAGQSVNLLRSGRFTSLQQMASDGWTLNEADANETVRTAVEMRAGGPEGRSCLRLAAATGAATGKAGERTSFLPIQGPLVQVQSPILPVREGQILHVSGRIRVPQSLDPTSEGLVIYNTIDGPSRALRFRSPTSSGQWETFELVSVAPASGEFALRFELRGLGDVFLDDLRIVALNVSTNAADVEAGPPPASNSPPAP